jgi:hypothetical protein
MTKSVVTARLSLVASFKVTVEMELPQQDGAAVLSVYGGVPAAHALSDASRKQWWAGYDLGHLYSVAQHK